MSERLGPPGRLIWSLAGSGLGSSIGAAGNSGAWSGAGGDKLSAVDLRDVQDVVLLVNVASVTMVPATVVSLNIFDDQGNSYPSGLTTNALMAAGQAEISGGLHGLTGKQIVFPLWGQVAWTAPGSGASLSGVAISLFGR